MVNAKKFLCPMRVDPRDGNFNHCVEDECALYARSFDQSGKPMGGFCAIAGIVQSLSQLVQIGAALTTPSNILKG